MKKNPEPDLTSIQIRNVPKLIARVFRGQSKIDDLTYGQMLTRLVEIVLMGKKS